MLLDENDPRYAAVTRPHTSSVSQHPVRVAIIGTAADLPVALREVAALERSVGRPLRVVPQATGHGAGALVDESVVIFDTSALTEVSIDPDARTARVGAGATWSAVNREAQKHGLLGLAGSAPSVAVSGYTFGGGIGWLARRDGLASGSLRAVHYVDSDGRLRIARDDAEDEVDREAIWSFRGAGGVGIAHTLEFDLVPAPDLHAGALLWPVDALPELVAVWSRVISSVGAGVSSSLSVLHVPPLPAFPEELRGKPALHLALADPDGPASALPLIEALCDIAEPVMNTWGPTDAAGLARIHLDPPAATPAVGDARWLDASTPQIAAQLFSEALTDDAAVVMVELRHLAGAPASTRDGAVVAPPGHFIYHAVGSLDLFSRDRIDATFVRLRSVWSSADAGTAPGSWIEGAPHVPHALSEDLRARAGSIADVIDPQHRFLRSRLLG
ncbi:FAD-linked oxidase [Subtercola boreus]|uniref:FAD-linked oxidase n=1 Tax=Subtercola boreus TaxID=120213 RepID=A0A3E0VD00_9MICO|nr:FAD-binding protein [Subtercola boreus]RFA07529.1 FAD-linked oxidase [Subtercola boreus]